jgi:hypothetical protein
VSKEKVAWQAEDNEDIQRVTQKAIVSALVAEFDILHFTFDSIHVLLLLTHTYCRYMNSHKDNLKRLNQLFHGSLRICRLRTSVRYHGRRE